MTTYLSRLRGALVLLLVGSACLFFVGSTVERHHRHHESAVTNPAVATGESGGETGSESGSKTTAEGTKPAEQRTEAATGETGAKLLGINTESLALSIAAVVASILLAGGVWLGVWPRVVLLAVMGFGVVFAAGDIREVIHQVNESNSGLTTIAAILIVLHILVSALAAAQQPWRAGTTRPPLNDQTI